MVEYFDHSGFMVSSGPENSNPHTAAGKEKQGPSVGRVYQECRSTRLVNNVVILEARRGSEEGGRDGECSSGLREGERDAQRKQK